MYYGYVYIWLDTKYRKYIIGSHHGSLNDNYKTSTGGIHVRNIFKYRPHTMKFRVLEYNTVKDDRQYTLMLEQKWLNKRPNIKENPKYYNKTNMAGGGFDREIQIKRVKNGTHHFLGGKIQRELNLRRVKEGKHNFTSKFARKNALKRIQTGNHHFLKSDFNKRPFELKCTDGRKWKYASKVDAVKDGFTASVIDRLKIQKIFTYQKNTNKKKKIQFRPGDTLYFTDLQSPNKSNKSVCTSLPITGILHPIAS
jgi:hypothetical protein